MKSNIILSISCHAGGKTYHSIKEIQKYLDDKSSIIKRVLRIEANQKIEDWEIKMANCNFSIESKSFDIIKNWNTQDSIICQITDNSIWNKNDSNHDGVNKYLNYHLHKLENTLIVIEGENHKLWDSSLINSVIENKSHLVLCQTSFYHFDEKIIKSATKIILGQEMASVGRYVDKFNLTEHKKDLLFIAEKIVKSKYKQGDFRPNVSIDLENEVIYGDFTKDYYDSCAFDYYENK